MARLGANESEAKRERFHSFAVVALVYAVLVIAWGAYVRATGSGAGCGEHWPLCNGQVVPRSPSTETLIELVHRITSGGALLSAVWLYWLGRRTFAAGHPARRAAAWSLTLMITEALIGAGLVLLGYVATNQSIARAYWMVAHLANTFALLGALTVAVLAAGPRFDATATSHPHWSARVALGLALLVGASGAVAALGDTLFPAGSLASALAQDFSPAAHVAVRLRVLHPLLALGSGAYVLFLACYNAVAHRGTVRANGIAVGAIVVAQMLVGALNVALLAPVALQLVHLVLADVLWVALVCFSVHLARERPLDVAEPRPDGEARPTEREQAALTTE